MGIYYNPHPPFIGGPQPLEKTRLIPQSGPLPQNPPFRGSRVGQETLNCWAAAVVAASLTSILPPLLVPQPVAAAPLFRKHNYEIYRAWDAPALLPIVATRNPPVSGPIISNPPLGGAAINQAIFSSWNIPAIIIEVPSGTVPMASGPAVAYAAPNFAILAAWQPVVPAPIVGPKFTLGISAATNPPFVGGAKVPLEVQIGWLPPAPAAIAGPKLTVGGPSNPQFSGGARVATEVLVGWLPPAPTPLTAINLRPPISGPASSNPPFMGGAHVSREILNAWLPPLPAPVVAVNLNPLILGGQQFVLSVSTGSYVISGQSVTFTYQLPASASAVPFSRQDYGWFDRQPPKRHY